MVCMMLCYENVVSYLIGAIPLSIGSLMLLNVLDIGGNSLTGTNVLIACDI